MPFIVADAAPAGTGPRRDPTTRPWPVAAALALVVAFAMLAACSDTPGVVCSGGGICAEGLTCDEAHDLCVTPEQLTACADLGEGDACQVAGRSGFCDQTVCLETRCGDGRVTGAEQCDGENLGAKADCSELGFYGTKPLTCVSCAYDRPACFDQGYCGDGLIQGEEECDGANLDEQDCASLGYGDGTLACGASCTFNVLECAGRCGDGKRDPGEECDGADFGALHCGSFDYYAGTLACSETCDQISTTGCTGECGDGTLDAVEVCDTDRFNGVRCEDFGFYDGDLTCNAGCRSFDIRTCGGYCGDGILNGDELCDGDVQASGQTCRAFNAKGGALGCSASCQPTFDRCYWGGWRSFTVEDSGRVLSLWGSSNNDVWAVGERGLVLHYNGHQWGPVRDAEATGDLLRVTGRSRRDVWAVGAREVIHFDGAHWGRLPLPAGTTGRDVAGTWPDDVWVVGSGGVQRYHGGAWASVDAQISAPTGVWSDGDEVWVTGAVTGGAAIARFAGGAWTTKQFPGSSLAGLWGERRDYLWAYGSITRIYDGADWKEPRGRAARTLTLLWGSERGLFGFDGHTLMTYAGRLWRTVTTPLAMRAAWGTSVTDLWAASDDELQRYDGPGWITTEGRHHAPPIAVWAGDDAAWAVSGPDLLHNDGSTIETVDIGPVTTTLRDVWGTRTRDGESVWVVGDAGFVARGTGDDWDTLDSPGRFDINAISGSAADDVWVVGTDAIAHWNGSAWQRMSPRGRWVDVWATSRDDAWMLRSDGAVGHVRRGELSITELRPEGEMRALWASGPGDVWMVGPQGRVHYFDGTTVREVALGTRQNLHGIWGSGPSDIWIVGEGRHYHYDGTSWSSFPPSSESPRRAIGGTSDRDVWVTSADGTFSRLGHTMPTLSGGGRCERPLAIHCSAASPTSVFGVAGVTGGVAGAVPTLSTYDACGEQGEESGEVRYRLDSPINGDIVARLTPHDGDLDLFAFKGNEAGCDLTQCMGHRATRGPGAETVTVRVKQAETVYFIVDGPVPSRAGFTLEVTCQKKPIVGLQ